MWHSIGRQLRNPTGMGGLLTGSLMRFVNETPNRLAIDALHIGSTDTVLELGFGPGHAIKLAAARTSGLVYGVDQSRVMLEQARRRNRTAIREGRVVLHQGRFDLLPVGDASVDKILAVNVIYFWRDVQAIAKEVRRVLRPDGRVSIYATDASTMQKWKFASEDTHRLFAAADLSSTLREGGFDEDEIAVNEVRLTGGIQGLLATIVNRA
ncbi:methyltransferase domain-containing protein [Parvibaculum sedimenti]|uniref:Methyltransferase domain-containing protein n=1 Tax=Parvibaculum sedimenti TaxID=2608632 RepID=A0A6N6VGZ4_9HYPH|nr:class I SAM-dependent methyltransferase [Parvibaculum sedimenti]KAB7739978.1 methyltransferase domain-containing protein [Parvibaculum sedimenti]